MRYDMFIQGLNTSTSPVLLETTVPPDFGDLKPREEGQLSELRWFLMENIFVAFLNAFYAGCLKLVQRLSQNEWGAENMK